MFNIFANSLGFGAPMAMNVSHTHTSFCARMGRSLCGVCFGFLLVIAMIVLLAWNEGRAVNTEKALKEGLHEYLAVGCAPIDPANEGKLIYISCPLGELQLLEDREFRIAVNAVRLIRSVEMFQYKEYEHSETKKNSVGGGTTTTHTYTYSTVWSSDHISSSSFHIPNMCAETWSTRPCYNPDFTISGVTQTAQNVHAGDFVIPPSLYDSSVTSRGLESFANTLPNGTWTYQPSSAHPPNPVRLENTKLWGYFLITGDGGNPVVGDTRIQWRYATATAVSILAQQSGSSLAKWVPSGTHGYGVYLLREGQVTPEDMISDALNRNTVATWIIRFVGTLLIWLGMQLLTGPIALMPDIIPFIGPCLGDLVGCLLCYVTCLSATVLSFLVIGLSWLAFRPQIGVPLFIIALVLIIAICAISAYRRKTRKTTSGGGGMEMAAWSPPAQPLGSPAGAADHNTTSCCPAGFEADPLPSAPPPAINPGFQYDAQPIQPPMGAYPPQQQPYQFPPPAYPPNPGAPEYGQPHPKQPYPPQGFPAPPV